MPAQYEAMRDKFEAGGMGAKAAKKKAARIYNSKHPGHPVTNHSDKVHIPGGSMHELVTLDSNVGVDHGCSMAQPNPKDRNA